MRLVKVENDGHLDYEPMLFLSVGGGYSPPITSIYAAKVCDKNAVGRNDMLCVIVGGKDGGVTTLNLYEN